MRESTAVLDVLSLLGTLPPQVLLTISEALPGRRKSPPPHPGSGAPRLRYITGCSSLKRCSAGHHLSQCWLPRPRQPQTPLVSPTFFIHQSLLTLILSDHNMERKGVKPLCEKWGMLSC